MLWFQLQLKKTINEINKTTFRDELQRSVLLSLNEQIEDHPECRTADGYKTHLELLSKHLKSKGRLTVYTACMIGRCLSELKQNIKETRNFSYMEPNICLLLATSIFSLTCLISRQLIIGFRAFHCR